MNASLIDQLIQVLLKITDFLQANWIALSAAIVSIISLVITLQKNIKDRRYSNDKDLVEQLKQSLELAYRSLENEYARGKPTNDRMRWLAAARHISRFRELQAYLKTSLHKIICDEQEEYWRDKIYCLLQEIDSSSFFKYINPEKMVEERINLRSAAIVYSFSVWKEGRKDPLDNLSIEDIIQKYKLFSPMHHNFWGYFKTRAPQIADKFKDERP